MDITAVEGRFRYEMKVEKELLCVRNLLCCSYCALSVSVGAVDGLAIEERPEDDMRIRVAVVVVYDIKEVVGREDLAQ